MNIWLVAAFEPTPIDNTRPMRFMGIADAAVGLGHKVTFFTSAFKHSNKTQRYQQHTYHNVVPGRYDLVFLHSKPYKGNISVSRMLAHHDLAKKLLAEINNRTDKPDMIYISLPPLSTVQAICKWGAANDVPVVVDIIDPWPDVFLKAFPAPAKKLGRMMLSPFYKKLSYILNNCAGVTAISKQYTEWAATFYKQPRPTAYFYPAIQFSEVQEAFKKLATTTLKPTDKLHIIYAGSLASSYDIPAILEAATIVEQQYPGKTKFLIAGTGTQEELVKTKEKELPNVTYLGWLGQEEIYQQFYLADVGLTQHVPGATQSVTYKLFDYLGAGLPILNSLVSEMADIITDNHVGFNNISGSGASLAQNVARFLNDPALLPAYKNNALRLTAREGDAKVVYTRLVHFLQQFVKQP
jgi:glycosyltransferase involved in cell wall biosynthesis